MIYNIDGTPTLLMAFQGLWLLSPGTEEHNRGDALPPNRARGCSLARRHCSARIVALASTLV